MADFGQLIQASPPASTSQPLDRLRRLRDGRELITLVVGRSNLHPSYIEPLYEVLEAGGPQESLDLFIQSTGGQAEVPWAIVSLLREFCDRLTVLVPLQAMSGGTHVALAGEELIMGPISNLGSVDPKRSHHLLPEPNVPHSVQDLKHCMEFINRQWPETGQIRRFTSQHARSKQIGEIVRELFEHVHPLAIGALEQSYELSRLLTRKILAGRRDFHEKDPRIDRIEEKLAGEYYSHGFFIYRDDVETELELPVTRPSDEVWQAMRGLLQAYRQQLTARKVQDRFVEYAAFIENRARRRVLVRVYKDRLDPQHAEGETWWEA